MRLSSIKLAGFKSFVEPSKIPFPDQMTCVVGPNGCGKSNVIDAVRWVLGESSAKNLRGDAMTDVIFNGSTTRKPISQASVELIFDNTQDRLPGTLASRNTIAIKRLVTREGVSQYFINGDKCRKRDITDIFLGTGLGPRSYAIIEQGMISRLIESKPQDLRIFLEEAAGVSKYKERRRETQTRLNSTRDNLERLLDLRTELESQLAVLTEQAEKASIYTKKKAEERTLKGQITVLKWQAFQQKLLESEEKLKDVDEQIAFFMSAHTGHDDVISALKLAIEQASDSLGDVQHQEYQLRNQLARTEQDKIHKQSQKAQLVNQTAQLNQQISTLTQTKAQTKEKIADFDIQLATCQETLTDCEEKREVSLCRLEEHKLLQDDLYSQYQHTNERLSDAKEAIYVHEKEIQSAQHAITHNEQKIKEWLTQLSRLESELKTIDIARLTDELSELQTTHSEIQHQINELYASQAEKESEYSDLKLQFAAKQHEKNTVKAKISALEVVLHQEEDQGGESLLVQITASATWLIAIETSLNRLTTATVAKHYNNALSHAHLWPSTQAAKAKSLAAHIEKGAYPALFNVIAAIDNDVVPDDALWQSGFIMAVNQQGDMFGENWFIPSNCDEKSSLLVKHQTLKSLHIALPELEVACEDLQQKLSVTKQQIEQGVETLRERQGQRLQIERNVSAKQTEHDFLSKQFEKLCTQQRALKNQIDETNVVLESRYQALEPLSEALEKAQTTLNTLKDETQETEQQYHNAKLVTRQLQEQYEQDNSHFHKLQLHTEALKNQQSLTVSEHRQIDEQLLSKHDLLEEIAASLEEVMLPLAELDEVILQSHEALEAILQVKSQKQVLLESEKQRLKETESNIGVEQKKLDELKGKKQALVLEQQSYQLKSDASLAPLSELNANLKEVIASLPDNAKQASLQAKLNQVSQEIAALGPINLAAIDEFEKASERKNYLDQQYDDLTSALDTLETAIIKIDRETKQRFKTTFDQVNEGLQHLFPKVFGGGSAYLALTSDDLLDTGVAIMARPPGKKNATIHLLSGGEKALTALSLVFAIFQLNPSPFCMLDEVDAPLDDANVVRFCRLVEEMSKDVQFIYISHNKIAMEMAARLTGVTMAEPGVSRVVAVDIEKALEMSESVQ